MPLWVPSYCFWMGDAHLQRGNTNAKEKLVVKRCMYVMRFEPSSLKNVCTLRVSWEWCKLEFDETPIFWGKLQLSEKSVLEHLKCLALRFLQKLEVHRKQFLGQHYREPHSVWFVSTSVSFSVCFAFDHRCSWRLHLDQPRWQQSNYHFEHSSLEAILEGEFDDLNSSLPIKLFIYEYFSFFDKQFLPLRISKRRSSCA